MTRRGLSVAATLIETDHRGRRQRLRQDRTAETVARSERRVASDGRGCE
jgi:hypothetical protein